MEPHTARKPVGAHYNASEHFGVREDKNPDGMVLRRDISLAIRADQQAGRRRG